MSTYSDLLQHLMYEVPIQLVFPKVWWLFLHSCWLTTCLIIQFLSIQLVSPNFLIWTVRFLLLNARLLAKSSLFISGLLIFSDHQTPSHPTSLLFIAQSPRFPKEKRAKTPLPSNEMSTASRETTTKSWRRMLQSPWDEWGCQLNCH